MINTKNFKDIYFLISTPLTKRDHQRFGINRFIKRGYRVGVIDLTFLLNPDYVAKYKAAEPSEYSDIISIRGKKEFEDFFASHPDCLVIDFVGGSSWNIFIYKTFKKHNILFAQFCSNTVPLPEISKGSGLKKFANIFIDLLRGDWRNSIRKIKFLQYCMPVKVGSMQAPRFIIAGGKQYTRKLPCPDRNTEIIWAHTLDYDIFLEAGDTKTEKKDYAVFLDEYFPYHPDFLVKVIHSVCLNPSKYYGGLNNFFKEIEHKSGLPVLIAAHPSSQYDLKPGCFEKREVMKGKTTELVRNARFVIAHSSTSVNFAVLYQKPIIFLTSDEINQTWYGNMIRNFASQFNKKPLNVDSGMEWDLAAELIMDEESYQRYYTNYIKTPGSPQKPFWEIVADRLQGAI